MAASVWIKFNRQTSLPQVTGKEKTTVSSIEKELIPWVLRPGVDIRVLVQLQSMLGRTSSRRAEAHLCTFRGGQEEMWHLPPFSVRSSSSDLKNFISFTPNPAPFSSLDSEREGQRPGTVQVRAAVQRLAGNFLPTVPHEAKFQQQKSGPLTPRMSQTARKFKPGGWAERTRLHMPTREDRKVRHPQCP